MSRANKKQRHKARRQAKRRAVRRQESISPVKRLADAKGEIECWMSDGFQDLGQMQLFVYKRAAGLNGVACFLVDRGVVGLKDAWTRMRVDRTEFDSMMEVSADRGIEMRRCTPNEVRRWVAGGVRWAHDNGMRLPKDWVKAASFIGGVGDRASADVSEFAMEFAGRPDDLRQRLIGQPFDAYIQRTDIDFLFSDNAPMMDIESGDYFDTGEDDDLDHESILDVIPGGELESMLDRLTGPAIALTSKTATWLTARGETPSPELVEAWRSVMVAFMLAGVALPDGSTSERAELHSTLIEELLDGVEESRAAECDRAADQVYEYLEIDPGSMQEAVLRHMASQSEQAAEPSLNLRQIENFVQK